MFAAALSSCNPFAPPKPPGPDAGTGGASPIVATGGARATGGSSSTGGSSGADGYALCVASVKADPGRAQQAKDNGLSVAALAATMCSFETVKNCFAKGLCK